MDVSYRNLVSLFFFVAVFCPTHAAEFQRSTVTFRVLCLEDKVPEAVMYLAQADKPPVLVEFSPNDRSEKFEYLAPGELVFFREFADAEGKMLRFPIASVNLPTAADELLLLFVSGGNPSRNEEYSVFALADSLSRFAPNTVRLFNATQVPLKILFNEVEKDVARWTAQDFAFESGNNQSLPLAIAVEQDGEWRVVSKIQLLLSKENRYLLCVLPPREADSRRIRIKVLKERAAHQVSRVAKP